MNHYLLIATISVRHMSVKVKEKKYNFMAHSSIKLVSLSFNNNNINIITIFC